MLKVLLELGRISNLPTVWTNCLAAAVVAWGDAGLSALVRGGSLFGSPERADGIAAGLAVGAMTLMYTGGMFLNDAFDAAMDRTSAPQRPIPSGRISVRRVVLLGAAQLIGAWATILVVGCMRGGTVLSGSSLAATMLAGLIVFYDAHHKGNPLSPLLMGLCRVGVYASVGLLGVLSPARSGEILRLGSVSLLLLVYLMVLTWLAKREGRGIPSPVPIHVMIAAISLFDGAVLLVFGPPHWALLGLLGFLATLRLQRFVRGT